MIDKLNKDMIEAMKAKDKDRLAVIREVKSNLKLEQIDHKKEINDDTLLDVVNKAIKSRKDSIDAFKAGNREDLVEKTQKEIDVLMEYMPKQMSHEELVKTIDEVVAEVKPTSMKDMGSVMKVLTPKIKGKADMKEVSTLVRTKLSSL